MSTVQQWTSDLEHGDLERQTAAAEALAILSEDAQPAIPLLVQTCRSNDEALCAWCTASLENVGPPADDQLGDLIALAAAADENVAFWAITLLGRSGPAARDAVTILIERLGDTSSPTLQKRAAWALGKLGASATAAIEPLQSAAAGGDGPVASQARRALEIMQKGKAESGKPKNV